MHTPTAWKTHVLGCPAFKDFGVSFIDTDFFVAYRTTNGEVLPVEELADEVDTNSLETLNSIVAAAKNKGITHGNALYYYVNAKFTEENPGILYNDLTFIGSFDDPGVACGLFLPKINTHKDANIVHCILGGPTDIWHRGTMFISQQLENTGRIPHPLM